MITLYHKDGHSEVWGIQCKFQSVEPEKVEAMLAAGWVRNPLELKQQDERERPADINGDGKLSEEEAKAYLDSIGVDHSGLHWKKVVALAQEKLNEQDQG